VNRVNRQFSCHAASLIGVAFASLLLLNGAALAEDEDSCVECHQNRDFLVTNKKLYDYFQEWNASVHKQEDVSCTDCHGGNPDASDKKQAHGNGVGVADATSGIYYTHVPDTCGECHDDIMDGFKKSQHFQHILKASDEEQGPTCVTCHGSINVGILDANTVEAACERCHNAESDNFPENPQKAKRILNRFLSVHRFYRYISIRIDPKEAQEFFRGVDERQDKLAVTWHTFDLDQIEEETNQLLTVLKAKRDELKTKSKKPGSPKKAK